MNRDYKIINEVIEIIYDSLGLSPGNRVLDSETQLLGGIPEFDSMAVVSVLTAIEDHYGIMVDDDDVSATTFETIGSLTAFVESKLG